MCSLLGAETYCTEQPSCLAYLLKNIALNPELKVHVLAFDWDDEIVLNNDKYDCILGCDITYDFHQFDGILRAINNRLEKSGYALLCHDNDSCPLSKFSYDRLKSLCLLNNFTLEELDYEGYIPNRFYSSTVKLWKLSHRINDCL